MDGRGFDPRVRQHSFVANGHKTISTAIISLVLIQVEHLSITYEKLSTGKCLGSLPWNNVVRLTDRLDMTIVVDWDVKPQNKNLNC